MKRKREKGKIIARNKMNDKRKKKVKHRKEEKQQES